MLNADKERRIREWLEARDPGDAPGSLRAAIVDVPHVTRRAAFPALEALLRPWAPVRALSGLLVLLIILALAIAVVGAGLAHRSRPFPPPGLIAYTSPLGPEIHVVAGDGSGDRAVTATPDDLEHAPRWSPDGRTLLFVRIAGFAAADQCSTVGSIVLHDIVNGTERVLAAGPRPIFVAEWSPSGRQIAFLRAAPGCVDLERSVIDVASGRVTTTALGRGAWQLHWTAESVSTLDATLGELPSADDRFVADAAVVRDPGNHLRVLEQQTGGRVDLGPGGAASWSPDGTALAFVQVVDHPVEFGVQFRDRLAIAAIDTWHVRLLGDVIVPDYAGGAMPTLYWTHDGEWIYWIDASGGHVADVATGESHDLPPLVNGCTDLQWQPVP